jgi:glucose-1-phosphate thymidylyltransferase
LLREAAQLSAGAIVFAYQVRRPQAYGVVEFDSRANVVSIVKKPPRPRSSWAFAGFISTTIP